AGRPLGAAIPSQERTSKPGSVSATGTTPGKAGQGAALVTARARSLPDLIWEVATVTESTSKSTSPASTAWTGAAPPRYGTWVSFALAVEPSNSPTRCWVEPMPTELKVTLPASRFAMSSSSASDLAGWSARTAITKGKVETREIIWKSLTGW